MSEPIAVHHPTGQYYDAKGRAAVREWAKARGEVVLFSHLERPAPVDGILYSMEERAIVGVVEGRTRDEKYTYDYLMQIGGTYLVTHRKLCDLAEAGRLLAVSSHLVVVLACGTRLHWTLANNRGVFVPDITTAETRTRATSLGPETTTRLNAFIPMSAAERW